jgi:uncharacterized membrane protein YfcA
MLSLSLDIFVLLFVAGLLAGILNAIAGGASFFTFPALIIAGLPPLVANATNFVALVPSNIAALPAYQHELRKLGKKLIAPIIVGAIGGTIGALILIYLGGGIFANAVPYLMAFATLLFAFAPKMRILFSHTQPKGTQNTSLGAMALLFIFSIYGGYFGAGLGQIILGALILNGYDDFLESNAIKNIVISAISLLSVAVYILSGTVSWPHALVMMLGATIGGFLGGTFSKYIPQKILRFGVIVFGGFLTIYYFIAGL